MIYSIFMIIILINGNVFGKYIFEKSFVIASVNIDKTPPEIQIIKIENSNTGYEEYANKTHKIKIQVSIKIEDIQTNNFNINNIQILLGNNIINTLQKEIVKLREENGNIIYQINLNQIQGNGLLNVKLNEGIIIDSSGNKSKENLINTRNKN